MAGESLGVFDPTNHMLEVTSAGSYIDTDMFITRIANNDDVDQLANLGYPVIEVGRYTLTGSGSVVTSLTIADMIFFAHSSGGDPKIWASSGVSGDYTTAGPEYGITLTGGGLTATFNMESIDEPGGVFYGRLNGSGNVNGYSVKFTGHAAGAVDSGTKTFTGNAAGATVK